MKIAEISSRFLSINKFIVAIEKMGFALATKVVSFLFKFGS